jgi:predicted nucleotidyltransferase
MPSTRQSFLRHPISALLGTEASVRVLRELALHGTELTTTVLAQRTGVSDQSVRNVVNGLRPTGVLDVYGQGRAASYRLDVAHPIGRALLDLFRAEEERAENIQRAVATAAQQLAPPPLAVWLFGSVARRTDLPTSDLDLVLAVEDDATAERDANRFRDLLEATQREQQISVSVVPLSSKDIERLSATGDPFWKEILRDAISWYGKRPEALVRSLKRKSRSAPPQREIAHGRAGTVEAH